MFDVIMLLTWYALLAFAFLFYNWHDLSIVFVSPYYLILLFYICCKIMYYMVPHVLYGNLFLYGTYWVFLGLSSTAWSEVWPDWFKMLARRKHSIPQGTWVPSYAVAYCWLFLALSFFLASISLHQTLTGLLTLAEMHQMRMALSVGYLQVGLRYFSSLCACSSLVFCEILTRWLSSSWLSAIGELLLE